MARSASLKAHRSETTPAKKLETYRKMRDFSATKEPRGGSEPARASPGASSSCAIVASCRS